MVGNVIQIVTEKLSSLPFIEGMVLLQSKKIYLPTNLSCQCSLNFLA